MNSVSSEYESTLLRFAPTQHESMNLNCVGSVVCVCSCHWIYNSMKRTLCMAETGQESTCGRWEPGQVDGQWWFCELELKDDTGEKVPGNFSTGKPGQSDARMMCTPLGWQHPTQVSASCLGAGTSGFWLNSLQGKQLDLLMPAHLDAIFKSLIYMPSTAAAGRSWAAPLGGDSKCQISWKGAHSTAGESQPHTFGTPALD